MFSAARLQTLRDLAVLSPVRQRLPDGVSTDQVAGAGERSVCDTFAILTALREQVCVQNIHHRGRLGSLLRDAGIRALADAGLLAPSATQPVTVATLQRLTAEVNGAFGTAGYGTAEWCLTASEEAAGCP